MKIKTILLTAAIGSWVVTSMAQSAFSVNAVGYVNKTLTPGFNLISNPLDNADGNTINNLLASGLAPGTLAYQWNGTGFNTSTYTGNPASPWTVNYDMPPGTGIFISLTAETTVTFVGEVPQGTLTVDIPAGLSIVSSVVPQEGDLAADLGLSNTAPGTLVYFWNGAGYDTSTSAGPGGFLPPGSGVAGVGEAFFISTQAPVTWTREFSVND